MPQSFVSNHLHIVFSTYERNRWIAPEVQPKLWAYMAGTARRLDSHPAAIGGIDDHVHLLVALSSGMDIAQFMNKLKSSSSKWMKQHHATLPGRRDMAPLA